MHENKVLVVRHGPGRGRLVPYCQHVLDYIAKTQPSLRRRIQVHETGTSRPDLEHVVAVVFWLGDPLRQLYPACYDESLRIASEAGERGLLMINQPAILADYCKSYAATLWHKSGLLTPQFVTFSDHEEFLERMERVQYPVLVRGNVTHAQQGAFVVSNLRKAFDVPASDLPLPGIATSLIDVRAGRHLQAPLSIWSRFYHVKRAVVLGDIAVRESLQFGRHPIVNDSNSTFGVFAKQRKRLQMSLQPGRRRGMLLRAHKITSSLGKSIAVEQEFMIEEWDDPEILLKAASVLGLGFVAFDYASLADGATILWEANPYPHILRATGFRLPKERRTRARSLSMYEAFARFFENLLTHATPAT